MARSRHDELEVRAIQRLIAHMAAHGEDARVEEERPDAVERSAPAVDFAIRIGSERIGVEVTQILPAARSHYEIAAFERRIKVTLEPDVVRRGLGVIAVDLEFGPLPKRGQLDAAVPVVAKGIGAALAQLGSNPTHRTDIDFAPGVDFIRAGSLHQLPGSGNVLGFITTSGEWGGILNPKAEEFVDSLLAHKPMQTARWDKAFVVIVDRVGLIDADLVRKALVKRISDVPDNWVRIYYLPAVDGAEIVDLRPLT